MFQNFYIKFGRKLSFKFGLFPYIKIGIPYMEVKKKFTLEYFENYKKPHSEILSIIQTC